MNYFCTITTQSHLYKVKALEESLRKHGQNSFLHVLIIDDNNSYSEPNCRYWNLLDFTSDERVQEIIKKYSANANKVRWCLKSVFLSHLLQNERLQSVIYLDNDLFFYSDYQFLFDLLEDHSFLLTPHYYKHFPQKEQNWLEANFRVGLYNAGFVGVNQYAVKTLQWWADCCIYRCEKNSFRGLFDDQKYLDLVPVMEETATIVRNKGCNVAGWNKELCKREIVNDKVMIDGVFPIVFIHFNDTTIREILSGNDKLLLNYYKEYVRVLKKYKDGLDERSLLIPTPVLDKVKLGIWQFFTTIGN